MKAAEPRRLTHSLILALSEIPHEGLDIKVSPKFSSLYRPSETTDSDIEAQFPLPIEVEASVTPVASKVDLRGKFSTLLSGVCDRCTTSVSVPICGPLDTFLMAKDQFSPYDKPGGKVIHGPTRHIRPSRHHSKSKAEVLTDAEGEHEDENFGAFDGETVDLRPLIRELLILQIPMKLVCKESCLGLCLACAGNLNLSQCTCAAGPTLVEAEGAKVLSELAEALKERKTARKTF